MEQNPVVLEFLKKRMDITGLTEICNACQTRLQKEKLALTLPQWIRSVRMDYIRSVCAAAIDSSRQKPHNLTERLDSILTHRYLGLPLFLFFMYVMFKTTFDWAGSPLSDLVDGFIGGPLSDWTNSLLQMLGASEFTHALIVDGIIMPSFAIKSVDCRAERMAISVRKQKKPIPKQRGIGLLLCFCYPTRRRR